MPRLLGDKLPTYRKHRASGQAIVTLNGTDHYLGPQDTASSRKEYDRLISEWIANGRSPLAAKSDLLIVELIAAYLRFAKGYYGSSGARVVLGHCRRASRGGTRSRKSRRK